MGKIKEIRIVRCQDCEYSRDPAELGEEFAGTMYDGAVKCTLFNNYWAGRGFCSCGAGKSPEKITRSVDIEALESEIEERIKILQELTTEPKSTVDIGLRPYRICTASTLESVLEMLGEIK